MRAGEDTRPYANAGTVLFSSQGRSETGPRAHTVRPYGENGPETLARQSQAQKLNRTSGNFCTPRAQWPGRNLDPSLRFCAPEILFNLS